MQKPIMSYLSYLIDLFQKFDFNFILSPVKTNKNSVLSRKLIEQEIKQSLR